MKTTRNKNKVIFSSSLRQKNVSMTTNPCQIDNYRYAQARMLMLNQFTEFFLMDCERKGITTLFEKFFKGDN